VRLQPPISAKPKPNHSQPKAGNEGEKTMMLKLNFIVAEFNSFYLFKCKRIYGLFLVLCRINKEAIGVKE
jgi:hypothetical protein